MTESDPNRSGDTPTTDEAVPPEASPEHSSSEARPSLTESGIRLWIIERLAGLTGVSANEIDPTVPFSALGVDSVAGVELMADLETELDRELDPTLLFSAETPTELAVLLASGAAAPRRRRSSVPASGGPAQDDEPIAIVGIGCRFPGAAGPAGYWQLLVDGVDAVSEVPDGRWQPDPAMPNEVNRGGFVEGIDQFDPAFFGITQLEADRMDPQQRMLLEVAWESLEDAAVRPSDIRGTDVGVFVGISTNEYSRLQGASPELVDVFFGTGNALSIAANRVSYALDLTGPSIAVDTACSSSLVAVHMACSALRRGECSSALAGGANAILTPLLTLNFEGAGVIAPDGRCKTFDASADGIVRGEGAAMVHLKRLSDAIAEGDRIYAVVDGSAVNQDGRSNGLTAPNPEAQIDVFSAACATSGVDPLSVDYVEAHGTGTVLGDAMELRSLDSVYGQGRDAERPLLVGSVKTNIGHLESAAGVAGLIKTALALHHRMIPATLHFQEPNPYLAETSHVSVVAETVAWDAPGTRRAAVSGFGFGGTNAHVLLSSRPDEADDVSAGAGSSAGAQHGEDGPIVLPLSGRTATALAESVQRYATAVAQDLTATRALATAQALTRDEHPRRLAVVAGDAEGVAAALTEVAAGRRHGAAISGDRRSSEPARVAFLFSGQGRAWWPLHPELLVDPVIASQLRACDTELRELADYSLLELIRSGEPVLDHERAQPLLFALQVALARRWQGFGVEPSLIIGQSIGEIAAAHVAGALSLSDALEIVLHRGRLMEESNGTGHTAFVELPAAGVTALIAELGVDVTIAAVTAPDTCVVSGPKADTVTLVEAANARDVMALVYDVGDIPGHGPMMAPYAEKLADAVDFLEPRPTSVPMVSSVTASLITGETLDAAYWARNLREQVRLLEAIEVAVDEGTELFVEIAPHPVVTFSTRKSLEAIGADAKVLHTVKQGEAGALALRRSLASAWVAGASVDWRSVTGRTRATVQALASPWDHRRCWFDLAPTSAPVQRHRSGGWHPLIDEPVDAGNGTRTWTVHATSAPGVSAAASPGTLLELALAAARAATVDGQVALTGVRFAPGLPTGPDRAGDDTAADGMTVSVSATSGDIRWWISDGAVDGPGRIVADGSARLLDGDPPDMASIDRTSIDATPVDGPVALRTWVTSAKVTDATAVFQIDVPMPHDGAPQWAVGPLLLDVVLGAAAAVRDEWADATANDASELRSIQEVSLLAAPGTACRVVIDRADGGLTVVDEWGAEVIRMSGMESAPSRDGDPLGDLVVTSFEEGVPLSAEGRAPGAAPGPWTVLVDSDDATVTDRAAALAAALDAQVVDGPDALQQLGSDSRNRIVVVEPDPTQLVQLLDGTAVAGASVDVVTTGADTLSLFPALRRRHPGLGLRSIDIAARGSDVDEVAALVELLGREDGHDVVRLTGEHVEHARLEVVPVPGPVTRQEPAGDRDFDVVRGEDGAIHVAASPDLASSPSSGDVTVRVQQAIVGDATTELRPAGTVAGVAALGEVVHGPSELAGTTVAVVGPGAATRHLRTEADRLWPVADSGVALAALMRMQAMSPDLPAAVDHDPDGAAVTFRALSEVTDTWSGPVLDVSELRGTRPVGPVAVSLDGDATPIEVSSRHWRTSGSWAVIAADDDPLGDLVVDWLRERGADVVPLDDPDEDPSSFTGMVAVGAAPIEPAADLPGSLVWIGPSAVLLGDRVPDADETATAAAVHRRQCSGLGTTTLLAGADVAPATVLGVLERVMLHGLSVAVVDPTEAEVLRGSTTSSTGWFGQFAAARLSGEDGIGDDTVATLLAGAPPSEHLHVVIGYLAGEIAEIIGLDPAEIDPLEPLDVYGVDSLVGMEMRSRIESTFSYEVPLSELTRSMTTTALAHHLVEHAVPALLVVSGSASSGTETGSDSVAVAVRRGDGPTTWWVPGIFGTGEVFVPLGQSLDHHEMWALEAADVAASSVLDTAASHVRTILARQPDGPYRIGGYSYGALVAAEIALTLEASGAEVERLWLLDPPPPFTAEDEETRATRHRRVARLLAGHLAQLFGTGELDPSELPPFANDVELTSLAERLVSLGAQWEPERIERHLQHLWPTIVASLDAMAVHRPSGVVAAPTDVVVAARSGLFDAVPDARWSDFLADHDGPVILETDHVGLLLAPHAGVVAEIVHRSLDTTAARAVDPEDQMITAAAPETETALARVRRTAIEKLSTSERSRLAVGAVGNVYRQADYFLRALGAERRFRRLSTAGEGLIVGDHASIASVSGDPSRIRFGEHCLVDGFLNVREFGYFTMGSYSGLGLNVRIDCSGYVEIGNGCGLAESVYVIDGLHHPMLTDERISHGIDLFESHRIMDAYGPGTEVSFVKIEDLAWVGMRAIVLGGVTIGRGAVVAGGAVVSQDVPPFTVVAGNPARVVGKIPSMDVSFEDHPIVRARRLGKALPDNRRPVREVLDEVAAQVAARRP